MHELKKVVLITHSEFWRQGAGFWARTREIVKFLSSHTELSIFFLKPLTPKEITLVEYFMKYAGKSFRFIYRSEMIPGKLTIAECKKYIKQCGFADVYIVDKTENSLILDALPEASRKFLDTHDLISQRTKNALQFKAFSGLKLNENQEIKILKKYDGVICIQEEDLFLVSKWIGKTKAILAPHPVKYSKKSLNEEVKNIGFVASKWFANIDGLRWFLKKIWPDIHRPELRLNVFGGICEVFDKNVATGVVFHGLIPRLKDIYSKVDIVINPVRWGAGLKIKTLEAMANGLPLVTTAEGARGIMKLSGKAFLVANDSCEFKSALNSLFTNYSLRQSLGNAGYDFAKNNLSPESCYAQLLEKIYNTS
jgi:glycosyltransferase involved in cell wall biosynthesis